MGAAAGRGEPELAELFADDGARWRSGSTRRAGLLGGYFALEDPTPARAGRARAARRGRRSTAGLRLRGYVDRLDVAPDGDVRVVDYKTGAHPREAFEAKALFQMKFYALVLWRTARRRCRASCS